MPDTTQVPPPIPAAETAIVPSYLPADPGMTVQQEPISLFYQNPSYLRDPGSLGVNDSYLGRDYRVQPENNFLDLADITPRTAESKAVRGFDTTAKRETITVDEDTGRTLFADIKPGQSIGISYDDSGRATVSKGSSFVYQGNNTAVGSREIQKSDVMTPDPYNWVDILAAAGGPLSQLIAGGFGWWLTQQKIDADEAQAEKDYERRLALNDQAASYMSGSGGSGGNSTGVVGRRLLRG